MKYLLMLGLALLAWSWWRQRARAAAQARQQAQRPGAPQPMVPCAQCQVHVPQGLALQGRHGFYCSHEHLQRVEG